MSVKERVKEYANFKKISIRSFEKLSGLNYGYVNAIRVSIQPDKLKGIASYFTDLNINWLLTGEGEMLKSEHPKEEVVAKPNENEFLSYLKKQVDELKAENDNLKMENNRLREENGYYKGLLETNSIQYKQTAS